MFYKKMNKKIAFLVFLIVALVGILFILDTILIGPGLPPSEEMPRWYIPDTYKENEQTCTLLFPKISPYCNMVNISDGKFMIVWYFDDESEFLKGEDALYRYLEENGSVFQQKLNISTELQEKIKRDKANNTWGPTVGSHSFNATGYESPETSGYFLVYERPFLETREDYFVAYYGIMGLTNLTEETPELKKLIAESYYMSNEEGNVDGLELSENKPSFWFSFFLFLFIF
ncbi:hypothetical protein MSBRW_1052 [Methanosarcina barkeri str. Wiesmoor]|uniref:Methanolan biosynthesis EpsI domain-containing protein n=2 Tax=Methanosarcina barkeri TaxID=2208 RepID=A0A0E3QKE2_METBA|nr:hypothetical protein [Methanosarcina barkeri]AKB50305.1 hypothetical protein MSBRW_1052 [Methanosarcina barkeri str. Wiesmoor]